VPPSSIFCWGYAKSTGSILILKYLYSYGDEKIPFMLESNP
jgi:hypothetical protein